MSGHAAKDFVDCVALEFVAGLIGNQPGGDGHDGFVDQQVALKFEGAEGKEKIAQMLATLETETPDILAGQKVRSRSRDGKMVCIELANGGFIKGRPSGTEPKVRLYFCIGNDTNECAYADLEQIKKEILDLIK